MVKFLVLNVDIKYYLLRVLDLLRHYDNVIMFFSKEKYKLLQFEILLIPGTLHAS